MALGPITQTYLRIMGETNDRILVILNPLIALNDSTLETDLEEFRMKLHDYYLSDLVRLIKRNSPNTKLLDTLILHYSKIADTIGSNPTAEQKHALLESIINLCNAYDSDIDNPSDAFTHGRYIYFTLDSLIPHLINLLDKNITTLKKLVEVLLEFVVVGEQRDKLGNSAVDMLGTILIALDVSLDQIPMSYLINVKNSTTEKALFANSNHFNQK